MKLLIAPPIVRVPLEIRFGGRCYAKFDPSQKRNKDGEWGEGGGSGSKTTSPDKSGGASKAKSAKSPKISTRTNPRADAEKPVRDRAAAAKAAYNPSTKAKQDVSEKIEHEVTSALGGVKSSDNKPMDVISQSGRVGFEVKVLHDAKENRINMRKDSRQRKEAWVKEKAGRSAYIIAVDNRDTFDGGKHKDKYSGNKYYVYKGVGAVSLKSMTPARDLAHVKQIVGIK